MLSILHSYHAVSDQLCEAIIRPCLTDDLLYRMESENKKSKDRNLVVEEAQMSIHVCIPQITNF